MIPIPWLLAGLAGYLVMTGKAKDVLTTSSQEAKPPAAGKDSSDWLNPASQPNTANGVANTVSNVANAGLAIAGTIGKIVDWFNPPSSKSTSGSTGGGSRDGNPSVPEYLSNSSSETYEDTGFKFWG
jgi:hypothetical protein